jgi:hypothetical protein
MIVPSHPYLQFLHVLEHLPQELVIVTGAGQELNVARLEVSTLVELVIEFINKQAATKKQPLQQSSLETLFANM